MTNLQPPKQNISQARRKLIKASAAAPLVATLHPGAAMAASSAFNCAGGDFSNKKFAENGNSINGDTAIRERVDYYERKNGVGNWTDDGVEIPKKLYLIEGSYWDQGGDQHPDITNAILGDHYDGPLDAYVLVVYDIGDSSAQELGLWPQVQIVDNQQPLSQSCWTSISNNFYGNNL